LRQDHASPARIAKNIFPPLKPEQVEEAIRVLLELKLIKKLANGYGVHDRHLAAGRGFGGDAARQHNREFMRLGLEQLDAGRIPEGRYHVTSFSISRRGFARIRERIDSLRAEVRELTESDEGGDDRVYALALQLFPCSLDEGAMEAKPSKPGARSRSGTSSDAGIPAV